MRVRFTTSHPKDMSDETLHVIAEEPNVCRHIHLPVQSGSSRILKLMNRKYDREWYLERVAAIRRIIPDCGLSTDIFCGFPGETEEDHQLSLSLMEECHYDSAFMFKYSERPGTYASKHLPDDVSEEVKIRRLNEIIALQNRLSAEANAQCVGRTYEVLVEGVSKRSRARGGVRPRHAPCGRPGAGAGDGEQLGDAEGGGGAVIGCWHADDADKADNHRFINQRICVNLYHLRYLRANPRASFRAVALFGFPVPVWGNCGTLKTCLGRQ